MIKYHNKSNLRKKRFILANSSTEIRKNPHDREGMVAEAGGREITVHPHTANRKRDGGEWDKILNPQCPLLTPNDLLPSDTS